LDGERAAAPTIRQIPKMKAKNVLVNLSSMTHQAEYANPLVWKRSVKETLPTTFSPVAETIVTLFLINANCCVPTT
jgi:hypothetical protein